MQPDLQLPTATRQLRLGNLGPEVTEADLRGALLAFGPIISLRHPVLASSGRPGDFALVRMGDPGAAKALSSLNGRMLKGHRVEVSAVAPAL